MVDDLVTIYRFDQRACGRSTGGPPFDVAGAVADLEVLREHWGVAEWIVAGHSWGATLALAYCLEHPDRARALIYISGTGVEPAWHAEYHRNRAALLGREDCERLEWLERRLAETDGVERDAVEREFCEISWSIDIADRRRARELTGTLFVEGLSVNREVNRMLGKDSRRFAESEETREHLAALDVPALIIHGEADPRPAWAATRLAALLPHTTLQLLPGVGHLPWLERPELLRATLRSFILEVGSADADVGDEALGGFLAGLKPEAASEAAWADGAMPLRIAAYLTWEEPPLSHVTSARGIVLRDDTVLVVWDERDEPYLLPGGRCEHGESPAGTLRREIMEETGIEIRDPAMLGFLHYHHLGPKPAGYSYPYPDFLQVVYVARAGEERPEAKLLDEGVTASAFYPLSDIEDLPLRDHDRIFLAAARPRRATRGDPAGGEA